MHAAYPDWEIAFVYYSRALNQQIKALVERNYKRLTGESPNWDKLHIWHAWGSKELTGFYREVAVHWNCQFLNLNQTKDAIVGNESDFAAACRILEEESKQCASFLDAVLIDEGQDLPASFYRIAYRALHLPKRLYWAYDEAQGIDSLMIPTSSEIFGRDDSGKPQVDLSGSYPSGMQKSHNLNHCYRTPRIVLTAAHAINMGLLREGPPLQGVSNKDDWMRLGYEVLAGDFSPSSVKEGKTVVIERPVSTRGHPVDVADFEPKMDRLGLLDVQIAKSESEIVDRVVAGIQQDLENGLQPEDIAVVCLKPFSPLSKIDDRLKTLGIKPLALNNVVRDHFKEQGCVTLAGIHRAKGNEAYKVYAINLHMAGVPFVAQSDDELVARNQAFVALTRTKLWCVALGLEGTIMNELLSAKIQGGKLRFIAYNQASLRRSMEDSDLDQQEIF
jgi:superfamily I DNA and RNA helicase